MIPKFNPVFYFVFFVVVLFSCKGGKPSDEKLVEQVVQPEMVDTLFGNLSLKQQYFQHIVLDIPEYYQLNIDSLADWIIENEPGVIRFNNWKQDSLAEIKIMLDTADIIEPQYMVNYFDFLEVPKYPYWRSNSKNRSLKLIEVFQANHSHILDLENMFKWKDSDKDWVKNCFDSLGVKFITNYFDDVNVVRDLATFNEVLKQSDQIVELTLSAFDTVNFGNIRKNSGFEGVFMTNAKSVSYNTLLNRGVDYVVVSLEDSGLESVPFASWNPSEIERIVFNESTERILDIRRKRKNKQLESDITQRKEYTRLNLCKNSLTVLNAENAFFPLEKGIKVYSDYKLRLSKILRNENKVSLSEVVLDSARVEKIKSEKGVKLIVLSDSVSQKVLNSLAGLEFTDKVVVCFSNLKYYSDLKNVSNLVFAPNMLSDRDDFELAFQQLVGGLSVDGGLVFKDSIVSGAEIDKVKLARTTSAFCGISADSLKTVDYVVSSAINGRAFPGCQVIGVKNGCVFYDKSFGYHTYDRSQKVTRESMYDVASLTKVIATTMVGMKLYEMEGYTLKDSLSAYLPDSLKDHLDYPSTIRNITFQELFTHKSGLPAGFPVLKYMQYTSADVGRFDKYFCDTQDTVYTIEVAENFYLEKEYQDSMWLRLNRMWLDKTKPYKYSDVNMNTLYFIFKSIMHLNPKDYGFDLSKKELKNHDLFVDFLYDNFYVPLGMKNTKYKPLKHFDKSKIVATEKERFWRKQLLHGHVHDPNAALYGGVAGNAGIFSTANDLAILGEMLLNKGVYNGQRYLLSETVEKFTRAQEGSHRGLGWNKPSLNTSAFGCADDASPQTYGHTGFTGTCIWMDPVENITYVFLSNRVHPTVNNRIYQHGVRARVHQAFYDGIFK